MQSNSTNLFGDAPTKRCKGCGHSFPLEEFYPQRKPNGRIYRMSYCRSCSKKNRMAWHRTDRGKKIHRAGVRRRTYGLSIATYEAMLAKQHGLCAICRQPESRRRNGVVRALCVDHCHTTGKVRELLCCSCNNGIGYFKDDLVLLRSALDYLQRHTAES